MQALSTAFLALYFFTSGIFGAVEECVHISDIVWLEFCTIFNKIIKAKQKIFMKM